MDKGPESGGLARSAWSATAQERWLLVKVNGIHTIGSWQETLETLMKKSDLGSGKG